MSALDDVTPCPNYFPNHRTLAPCSSILRPSYNHSQFVTRIDGAPTATFSQVSGGVPGAPPATKPRRYGKSLGFAIHDEEDPKGVATQQVKPRRTSILAQPAVKELKHDKEFTPQFGPVRIGAQCPPSSLGRHSRVKIRESTLTAPILEDAQCHPTMKKALKKPARRGTMYIPPDDTTVPTVWMGAFSPLKEAFGDENALDQATPEDDTLLTSRLARKRGPRTSFAAEPPRRGPLRTSINPIQETVNPEAIPGAPTGKENYPPGSQPLADQEKHEEMLRRDSIAPKQSSYRSQGQLRRTTLAPNYFLNASANSLIKTMPGAKGSPTGSSKAPSPARGFEKRLYRQLGKRPRQSLNVKKAPSRLLFPNVGTASLNQHYPVISQSIEQPSLYEDQWLAHQELAITQLLNQLFTIADNPSRISSMLDIRTRLLDIYQDQSFVLLQSRLQASLLYGSLGVPKETLINSARLSDDLGMKKAFLDLWVDTYDLQALQACSEVVVGRDCHASPGSPSFPNGQHSRRSVSKQVVSQFIETLFVQNRDRMVDKAAAPEFSNVHNTLLRSLMMIKLLDKAKTGASGPIPGCLFQSSSPYKKSSSVIQALMRLLHPSVGNPIRPLNQLDYFVTHVQYPLEEYSYPITNLAIDLRDGIRLARLVEILLHPSASTMHLHPGPDDSTRILSVPVADALSVTPADHDWPLSQSLKFPCPSRATKLYNVQIALSALAQVKHGFQAIFQDITPEHIVDGFREKTVSLLWGLVGKWGVGTLIDWADLRYEIRRMGGNVNVLDEAGNGVEADAREGLQRFQNELLGWAAAAAGRKSIKVTNLTTSFADGKVFEAVVDSYEGLLNDGNTTTADIDPVPSLKGRLVALGCSLQFASLFDPTNPRSPIDKSFTLLSLSFLAARLLPASRPVRAAQTVQRAWRAKTQKDLTRKKVVLKRLADECRIVVEMREKMGWAKETIWRAWTGYAQQRKETMAKSTEHLRNETTGESADEDGDGDAGDIWLEIGRV